MVDDVVFHSLEIGGDRRQILIGPQHRFVTAFEHIGDHLVIEMAKLVLHFFIEAVETHMKFAYLAFEREPPVVEVLLLRFGHGLHGFVGHGMSVFERHEPESRRRFIESEPAGETQLGELLEQHFLLRLSLVVQLGFAIKVLLAFERCGDVAAEALDEGGHVPFEGTALPGGKGEADRTGRILEVVDVAPVGRSLGRLGQPCHHLTNQGGFACADRAGDVQIESRALHRETELQRFDRPLLADNIGERFEFARVFEPQLCGIDCGR